VEWNDVMSDEVVMSMLMMIIIVEKETKLNFNNSLGH
jgi:hypothetical protein